MDARSRLRRIVIRALPQSFVEKSVDGMTRNQIELCDQSVFVDMPPWHPRGQAVLPDLTIMLYEAQKM
jgi:hypothetical protein